jgi:DNA-binding transcriptional regulator YhcF (GntR family)
MSLEPLEIRRNNPEIVTRGGAFPTRQQLWNHERAADRRADRLAAIPNPQRGLYPSRATATRFIDPVEHQTSMDRAELYALIYDCDRFMGKMRGQCIKGLATHRGLTHTHIEVFRQIVKLTARHGVAFPSYTGLAKLANCDRSTAIEAVKRLVAYGFIQRIPRLCREVLVVDGQAVTATRQGTNIYKVLAKKQIRPFVSSFERFARKREKREARRREADQSLGGWHSTEAANQRFNDRMDALYNSEGLERLASRVVVTHEIPF